MGPPEKRENCQVGVFLAYVTAKGHPRISRELSLPLEWREDQDRCQVASIPETVRFRTKPELVVQMMGRIFQAAVPILHRWEDDGRHWLLMRRSLTDPQEKAYYARLWTAWNDSAADGAASGARWHIE